MNELKKTNDCPFCGSNNIYVGEAICCEFHVQCRTCFASSGSVTFPDDDKKELGLVYWEHRCKELAIEKWNQRI